ncbi:MAG: cysteine methyltransferase, partial [Gemmatimonadota bacterium]
MARIGPLGLRPGYRLSPYQRLFGAIVYQQLSGQAASTILGRVRALFGDDDAVPEPAAVLEMPDGKMRGAGLSQAKMLAIQDLARKSLEGVLPELAEARQLDDEALIERLVVVRGIGRWTAEMLLIGGLGRPDVLPVADLGIQKGFRIAYRTRKLPDPSRILRHGRRWQPYRTIASWYLWRATDSNEG